MRRRTFLQLLSFLPFTRPRQQVGAPAYTDSAGNVMGAELFDNNPATGITYGA